MSDSVSSVEQYTKECGHHYRGVSWIGESRQGAILIGAYFEDADLRFVNFQGANLWGATLIRCDLRGAHFAYAQLGGARLIGCQLSDDTLEYASLEDCVISDLEPYRGLEAHLNDHVVRYVKSRDYVYAVYCWRDMFAQPEQSATLKPIVMLHGHTGHALDFLPLALRLSPRPVYAVQLLGHGETSALPISLELELDDDWLPERVSPSYAEVVEDVTQVITALVGDAPEFDLLGYSMGGRLALHIALHLTTHLTTHSVSSATSARLRRAIVIGASLGLYTEGERSERRARDRLWSDPLWESDSAAPFLEAWRRQPLLARLYERAPDVYQRLSDHRQRHTPQGLALAFDALGQGAMPPLHDLLPTLSIPVYWVYGGEDAKYRDVARRAESAHALSEAIEIPGLGHSPHLEGVERAWEIIEPLLRD